MGYGAWVRARSTSRSLSDTSGVGGPVWGRGDVLCRVESSRDRGVGLYAFVRNSTCLCTAPQFTPSAHILLNQLPPHPSFVSYVRVIQYSTTCHIRQLNQSDLHKSGTAVAQWLRCCATNRKVAGSIPADVSGFFILPIALWHWGGTETGCKGGRCVRLTTYHHPVPLSRNLGTSTSWNSLGL